MNVCICTRVECTVVYSHVKNAHIFSLFNLYILPFFEMVENFPYFPFFESNFSVRKAKE